MYTREQLAAIDSALFTRFAPLCPSWPTRLPLGQLLNRAGTTRQSVAIIIILHLLRILNKLGGTQPLTHRLPVLYEGAYSDSENHYRSFLFFYSFFIVENECSYKFFIRCQTFQS